MVSDTIDRQKHDSTVKLLKRQIDTACSQNYTVVDFFGGEPTTQPNLIGAIHYAASRGMKCCLATNALVFSRADYAERFFSECSIDSIRTTLHSHDPKIHDAITQVPSSHRQTVQGIKNILKYVKPNRIVVNIVIGRHNVASLEKIVRFISDLDCMVIKFSGLIIEGRALQNSFLAVSPDTVKHYLLKAVRLCSRLKQLFLVEKLADCFLDCRFGDRFIREQDQRYMKLTFMKLKGCDLCPLKSCCTGFEKKTLVMFGVPKFYSHFVSTRLALNN